MNLSPCPSPRERGVITRFRTLPFGEGRVGLSYRNVSKWKFETN